MAINEACQVWIEQRIQEEKERGTSDAEIGRILASEILKYFEVGIRPRTIEQKSRRFATNVASSPTSPPSNEIQENQVSEPSKTDSVSDLPAHGGKREGSGRPTKYEQDTDALFQLKRWWKLASKKDQKTFMNWIGTEE